MRIAGLRQLKHGRLASVCAPRSSSSQYVDGWTGVFTLSFLRRLYSCHQELGGSGGDNLQGRKEGLWEDELSDPEGSYGSSLHQTDSGSLQKFPAQTVPESEPAGIKYKTSPVLDQVQRGQDITQFSTSGWQFQALCDEGQLEAALEVLLRMDQEGSVPLVPMYRSLLTACAKKKSLVHAKRVHAHLAQHGLGYALSLSEFVVSTLVNCNGLADALQVFHSLPQKTVFSWTAVISGYTMAGLDGEALKTYHRMREEGVQPNTYTFVSLLKACGSIGELGYGRQIHADVLLDRCEADPFVSSCLVDMYGKCGSIHDAENVYNRLSHSNIAAWNALLAAYVQEGHAARTLQLYSQGREEGLTPDARTFVSMLQACSLLAETEDNTGDGQPVSFQFLGTLKAMHAEAQRKNCSSDVFLGSTLVIMYGKSRSILDARNVFDILPHQDVVTWNAMLTACVQQGQPEYALQLYAQMVEGEVRRGARTFVLVLQACGMLAEEEQSTALDGKSMKIESLNKGKALHLDARSSGCDADVFVGNCLISMYGKCGTIVDAQFVFDGLPQRDLVSWNSLLVACVEQGQAEMVSQLYANMQEHGLAPNEITFMSVLRTCSSTGSLNLCKQVHDALVSTGNPLSPLLATTLIHAYGACASMENAQSVFDALPGADVVSWNALIAGYAREGNYAASQRCYEQMQVAGTKPDCVTFLSLISACGHAGLAVKGIEYFESMWRDHGIIPGIEHYGCVVDLLVRTGDFARIEQLTSVMPIQPDLAVWSCVLGACKKHGQVALGKHAFDHAASLEPKHSATYLLMSSIYSRAGHGDAAKVVKELRLKQSAWKQPAQSWVAHEQDIHSFHVRDMKHAEHKQLYGMLANVSLEVERRGNLEMPKKLRHSNSEKLAMAFELLAAERMLPNRPRSTVSAPVFGLATPFRT